MRSPPASLVQAVARGDLSLRTRRGVLHHRGYFRALDANGNTVGEDTHYHKKDGTLTSTVNDITAIEPTTRLKRSVAWRACRHK